MQTPAAFEYQRATSVEHAVQSLAELGRPDAAEATIGSVLKCREDVQLAAERGLDWVAAGSA